MKWIHYFRQALYELRTQPLLGTIHIVGTALALFLFMIVVMSWQVKVAPFPPESKRDRMLYVQWLCMTDRTTGDQVSGSDFVSEWTAKECFLNLKSAEAVTLYSMSETMPASLPRQTGDWVDVRGTDATYWEVFDFTFVDGKPYDQAAFESGLPTAVITESLARSLYGEVKITGREFLLSGKSYRISGVVRDVSTLASSAYAQAWVPYRALGYQHDTWAGGVIGTLYVTILAHSAADFPAIRKECEELRRKFSAQLGEKELNYRNQPDEQEKAMIRRVKQEEPDMKQIYLTRWAIYAILLIVPAINLATMTQSRFRRRRAEIGVRRAFGATRGRILMQVCMESLFNTLLAGVLGLLLCFVCSAWGGEFLYGSSNLSNPLHQEVAVNWHLLFNPSVFGYALFFCLILNVVSSVIPAWKVSRYDVIKALEGGES